MNLQYINLPVSADEFAPDGSEIRCLARLNNLTMVHCSLPQGSVSTPVEHKTVEELWYFLSGTGELLREYDGKLDMKILKQGVSVNIPLGTIFQFRNMGNLPLEFIIVTSPPWPGEDEAIIREKHFDVLNKTL